jgi:hypothetical protein
MDKTTQGMFWDMTILKFAVIELTFSTNTLVLIFTGPIIYLLFSYSFQF